MTESRDPKEKKCTTCGKDMYAGEEWAYKRRDGKGKTKWFCYDAKKDGKQAAVVTVDEVAAAPKEPVSRAVLAKALAKEIKRGGSVIAYMKAEGYKNPWEAYNAVRHYCETKMPELAEVLKPLKDLPKGQPAQTGRPRKYPAKVEKVDKVPEVEPDLQPVQCIAHVTPAEMAESQTFEEQDSQGKIEAKSVQTGEQFMKQFLHLYSREDLLLIVDKAALDCQKDHRIITMSSSGVKAAMLQNATVAAENVGIMKLRKQIRKMLGAEDEE